MTRPNSDRNERAVMRNTGNPGSFINPLLDSSTDGPTGRVNVLRNLEIECKKSKRRLANRPIVPSHIPQSNLLMLQEQLQEAADDLASPEAYQRARDRELGLHSIADSERTVTVSNPSKTMQTSDRNERAVTRNTCNPGSFKNPLLDSSIDGPTGTDNLLRNLKREITKSKRLVAKKPSHIPQSSLLMLQTQLQEAAEAFSSPEAYRRARERELGIYSLEDS